MTDVFALTSDHAKMLAERAVSENAALPTTRSSIASGSEGVNMFDANLSTPADWRTLKLPDQTRWLRFQDIALVVAFLIAGIAIFAAFYGSACRI